MNGMNRLVALSVGVCALALSVAAPAGAEEGMWTFDAVPQARMEQSLGVKLDRAWFDRLRLASVRLSAGCSAALVSRQGLALTNQHCVLACAQSLSRPGRDFVADGFLSDARSDEQLCPGLEAEVLEGIVDVTDQIFAASAKAAGETFILLREKAIATAERDACGHDARLRCQVISFFGGDQFKVYIYRRYDDVRLVFAPEFATAFFGGDRDNFTFPRFDLDCAFVRLYDQGHPASTPSTLAWTRQDPRAGEAVFVSGNPGVTERGAAAAQLTTERDLSLPAAQTALEGLKTELTRFAGQSPENARLAADRLFVTENSLKVIRGRLAALSAPGFLDARHAEEAALQARITADPKLMAETGDPWAAMAIGEKARLAEEPAWRLLENDAGGGSQLYAWARMLVRAAQERARPTPERLPEYADSRLALDRKAVFDAGPASAAYDQLLLSYWLKRCQGAFGANSPAMTLLLAGDGIDDLAAKLASGSQLGDPALRRALWRGGLPAILASADPMITFVLRTDPLSRAARRAYEDDALGPEQRADKAIARARFAVGGNAIYPDATFSLRLSWGRVAGWDKGDTRIDPFTTLAGLYARADAADPLPPRWLAAKASLDPATVLDFVTTNDITGGSSGSPVVDAHGQILGTAFDGNEASIAGDFAYDGSANRTVVVSTAAITEALDKVYGRLALIKELEAR